MGYFTAVSQGVISPQEGQMVSYIQRSTDTDDDKGVEEKLMVENPFMTESWILSYESEEQWQSDFDFTMKIINDKPMHFFSPRESF